MKKYLLLAIAMFSVLLAFTACAKNDAEVTDISQETRDQVFEAVNGKFIDLLKIYHAHNTTKNMEGVANITLSIDKKGVVNSVKVDPVEGNLSKDMLKAVKAEAKKWTFPTNIAMNYQFKASFHPMWSDIRSSCFRAQPYQKVRSGIDFEGEIALGDKDDK